MTVTAAMIAVLATSSPGAAPVCVAAPELSSIDEMITAPLPAASYRLADYGEWLMPPPTATIITHNAGIGLPASGGPDLYRGPEKFTVTLISQDRMCTQQLHSERCPAIKRVNEIIYGLSIPVGIGVESPRESAPSHTRSFDLFFRDGNGNEGLIKTRWAEHPLRDAAVEVKAALKPCVKGLRHEFPPYKFPPYTQ